MVYLLKTGPYIKICFPSQPSLNIRLHQIRNASPYDIEVLACRPGTLEQERSLHEGAAQWRHRGRSEWYTDCPGLREYCDRFFFPGDPSGTQAEGCTDDPPSSSVSEQVSL